MENKTCPICGYKHIEVKAIPYKANICRFFKYFCLISIAAIFIFKLDSFLQISEKTTYATNNTLLLANSIAIPPINVPQIISLILFIIAIALQALQLYLERKVKIIYVCPECKYYWDSSEYDENHP